MIFKIENEGMEDNKKENNMIIEILKSGFGFIFYLLKIVFLRFFSLLKPLKRKFDNLSIETKKRIKSSLIICLIFVVAVFCGGIVYTFALAVCAILIIYELLKMLSNIEKSDNKTFIYLRRFGLFYITICFFCLILIRLQAMQGIRITFWLFLTCWGTDTFAYIFGKKFGKTKLAPTISKSKTYEGAILGSIGGVLISMLFYKLFSTYNHGIFSFISFVIISIIVVILSQLGDLTESAIKRKCNVKDSGTLIPGHGGVFDRFDSILLPSVFICIVLLFEHGVLF